MSQVKKLTFVIQECRGKRVLSMSDNLDEKKMFDYFKELGCSWVHWFNLNTKQPVYTQEGIDYFVNIL